MANVPPSGSLTLYSKSNSVGVLHNSTPPHEKIATLLYILVSGKVPPNSNEGEFTPVEIHETLLFVLYSQS